MVKDQTKSSFYRTCSSSALRRANGPKPAIPHDNPDPEINSNPSKRRYLFTDEQRRILKQTFENDQYPTQEKFEELVRELSLPMNKISNWFHNARMRTKPNSHSLDINQVSMSPLNDNDTDDELDDDIQNNNDIDDDDDDTLPTSVPLNNCSWLNDTHDSDDSNSPISYSMNPDPKPLSSISTSSSSSKKRKSIPQKIITTKKLYIDPTTENDQLDEPNT